MTERAFCPALIKFRIHKMTEKTSFFGHLQVFAGGQMLVA
jgi:hypothetical protein